MKNRPKVHCRQEITPGSQSKVLSSRGARRKEAKDVVAVSGDEKKKRGHALVTKLKAAVKLPNERCSTHPQQTIPRHRV